MQQLNALPRQPFIGLAAAASTGISIADWAPNYSFVSLGVMPLLTLAAVLSRRSVAVYAVVAAGFFLLHSLNTADLPGGGIIRQLEDHPCPVIARGHVVSEPKISRHGTSSFLLQTESIEIDGETRPCHVRLLTRWRHTVELGDEVELFGTAEPIEQPRNPGEFDMKSYLARQNIQRTLIVRYAENGSVLKHGCSRFILRAAHKTRDWLQNILSRDLEDSEDVTGAINGMILGLRHQSADDIEEPFQQTGTLHLFAVAGLHVGIVARLLWIVATVARLPRNIATILIIPTLLFYAAVTGLHTSSVRAAIMSAALLCGFLVERRAFALNNLAAAATVLLCWNTNELFSLGFQLSFSVVAAIVLVSEPTYRFFCRGFAPDPFLPRKLLSARQRFVIRCFSSIAAGGSVSFAAWLGSLPLMMWHYYLVTPISLLANLVVVPIAFFVLAGGLVSIIAAPFSTWFSVVFNNANWFLTKAILVAVHLFAQIPGGHSYIEHPHLPTGANLEINALDLKSGAAIHLRTKMSDWLCDTGSLGDYNRIVQPFLRSKGLARLDGLILTHGDAGHVGGGSSVLFDFHPSQVLDSGARKRSPSHSKLIEELTTTSARRHVCALGDQFDLSPQVKARILFPPRDLQPRKADDAALVIQLLVCGKSRVLIMSDSGVATEQFLLRTYPDLRSDVLIKGQHYSGFSGSESFLDSVKPIAIVASSTEFPEYERLKDEWVEKVRKRGIKLFRQDETGAVRIRFFRDGWETQTYLTSETFRTTNR